MPDVTQILNAIDAGDPHAADQLLPLVYEELRKLAAAKLAHEKPGQTLDATGLVHEAYVRLARTRGVSEGDDSSLAHACSNQFANRRHFFAAAAEAMRRILIENARRRARIKHGGQNHSVEFADVAAPTPDERLLALDEALTRLAAEDPAVARVVELRHFGGLGHEQIAETLGISVYEARQKWTYARAWLRDAIGE
jgi:RNA polymerase sigma factor (TIGR02999 family)